MVFTILLLVAGLIAGSPTHARGGDITLADAAGRYTIAPQDSELAFSVPKIGGGALTGHFTRFGGEVDIDGSDVARSSVSITIVPDSVATGNPRVEAFLKSDAVFDAANEDAISFRSTRVRRTGADTAAIEGALTARGSTHEATFQATLHDFGGRWISFHVRGDILRSRYGMDVGTPIYSNVVDFDMRLRATRQ